MIQKADLRTGRPIWYIGTIICLTEIEIQPHRVKAKYVTYQAWRPNRNTYPSDVVKSINLNAETLRRMRYAEIILKDIQESVRYA